MRDGYERIPTRRSLLSRLKDWNDQDSWRLFFDTYWKLIFNTAVRAGLTEDEAQDVVQETVLAVSKSIPKFVYDPAKGSFKAWLLRQTAWRIASQYRRRLPVVTARREGRIPNKTSTLERVPDPGVPALEALWEEEWENNLLDAALRRVKAKVDAKQYQVFDLCVQKKWPASKVAKDLKISSARVYLAKHRIGKVLKQELLYLQTKPI